MLEPLATFEPRRFRSTVPFYARYRLSYPERLIARVLDIVGLAPGDAALDLGCGPGLLAIAFARRGMSVTAVDPEPDMLKAAEEAAREAGVGIDFRHGSSFDLPRGIGQFKLVTMGRSFHWMDRQATLRLLDSLILSDGAVALFDDDHPRTVENRWYRAQRDLANKYGHPQGPPNVRAAAQPGYRTHESVLLDSPFDKLERCGVVIRRELSADEIVGFAFSRSGSSPETLGTRMPAFESELRAQLSALSPDGLFTEIAELSALIARRGR